MIILRNNWTEVPTDMDRFWSARARHFNEDTMHISIYELLKYV